jgi:hypothetical protein
MQLAPPQVARQPLPVGRPVRPDRMVVQGEDHRPSFEASQGTSTTPLASGIWPLACPELPPRRFHWVSAQAFVGANKH